MPHDLTRLVYRSRAREHASVPGELSAILEVSQRNNIRDGLTGALVFSGGWFIQVVEGPSAPVEALLERLIVDNRHYDIDVTEKRPAANRMFPDWCMASVHIEPQLEPELNRILEGWRIEGNETAELLLKALSCDVQTA